MNRITINWPRLLVLGLMIMFGANMTWAQAVSTGTVTGTVYLPDGSVTAGATVELAGPSIPSGKRTTVTEGNGKFVFLSVPAGTYTVTTSLAGFNIDQVEGVVLNAGGTAPFEITLQVVAAEGEIIVTSEAPIMNTRSSNLDTTFNSALLEVVPTSRDSFYDLTLTAAGMASVGASESFLPRVSAYGSATNENVFLVDGVNTTNPRGASWGSLVQVNYDTIQEVKVLSLGSRAEYGSFSGAAVDVLTKSGGNEFHGSVAYYTQLGNAADNSTTNFGGIFYADPNDDLTTEPIDNWEAAATIGGPILKDKLWFYFGFDRRERETDTPLWIPLDTSSADLWDLKITAQLAENHRLWGGFHYEDNVAGNITWGQTWEPSMRYDNPSENKTLTLQYQWVASDRNILGFQYLGFDTEQSPTIPREYGHPGFINWWKWVGSNSIGVAGDFPYVEAQKSERQTVQADFTHYADDWAGEHEIKFGVQYTTANGDWQGGYFEGYANFAYPYPWDYGPATNWWWNCEADSTGAFIDDQWVVSDRVTLNIGFRYDRMTAKYGTGYVYEMPDGPDDINNPTVLRERQGTDNIFDFKTFSPRLGFAWTITEDAKTVLRGHIGRYYAPLGVESLRRFGPDMQENLQETWMYLLPMSEVDLNGNGLIDFDEVGPATALLGTRDPDFLQASSINDPSWDLQVADGTTSPYTDQFNLSIQRQLGKDFAIEFSYIYKLAQDQLILRPYNETTGEFYEWESRDYTTWTGYETQAWSIALRDYNGDGVTDSADAAHVLNNSSYRAVNAGSFDGTDIERKYQGFQMVLNKRYSNRWQAMFAINYTDTNGFYPRPVDQNWYIDGPLVMDTPFGSTYNHLQHNVSGPALMTPEWTAKLAGSYTIPVIETDFGFRVRYDSGRAIFPIQSVGPTYQEWMGEYDPETMFLTTAWHDFMVADDPTTHDWLPSTTIFDLSLQKRFTVGNGMTIGITLDALNAFNESSPNIVGYNQGDYGRVYSLISPRVFRLGLRFDF